MSLITSYKDIKMIFRADIDHLFDAIRMGWSETDYHFVPVCMANEALQNPMFLYCVYHAWYF